MVRVCFLFYALLRQIRLIDLRKCDVTFAGIIVNKKLGELKLNPARKRDDIAWFLEAHHQSIDINPKSNGTAPKTTGVTSDTKNLDTSLNFSTSLPTYTPNTKGTPWVRHIKEYEIITNSISSEAQHQYVTKAFAEVHKTVVEMGAPKSTNSASRKSPPEEMSRATAASGSATTKSTGGGISGLASLNVVSRNKTHKRQKPETSPSKFKGAKKRREG